MTPTALVAHAAIARVSAIALTDHDTVAGLDEAMSAATAATEVIPGVEFSVQPPGPDSTVHLLGLFIDHRHPALCAAISRLQDMRADRNRRLLARLQELGCAITMADVERESKGATVGRVHFARALVVAGCSRSRESAFADFIGNNGRAAVPRERMAPAEAIALIRTAGGVPILAHPSTISLKPGALRALVKSYADMGLAGIEVFYPSHDPGQCEKFSRLAAEFNLVRSGGTDFHGDNKKDIRLGTGRGNLYVHDSLLAPIRALATRTGERT